MAGWIARLMPAAASEHAAAFDRVLGAVHEEAAILFVGWLLVFAFVLVRFRAGGARRPGAAAGSWPLLAIGAVVLADVLLLAGAALPTWARRAVPPPAGAVEVRVVGEQFAWQVHYPGLDGRFGRTAPSFITAADPVGIDRNDADAKDDFVLGGLLVVPVNRAVVVHLSAKDVIHSFTLPEMRVKQDVTPGLPSTTWFTPIATGSWEIVCSQLCGLGHYRMRGQFEVRTQDAWDAFVRDEVSRVVTQ